MFLEFENVLKERERRNAILVIKYSGTDDRIVKNLQIKFSFFLSRFNSRNGGFSLFRREEEFFFRETIPSTSLSSLESKTPICKNCAECTKDLRTAPRNRSQG